MARKDVYKNTSQFIVSKQPEPSNAVSPSGLSIPTINMCDTISDVSHNTADSTNNDTVIEGGGATTVVASNGDSMSTNRNTRRNRRRKQKQQQNRNNKPNNGPVGDETYDVSDGISAPPAGGGETITIDDTTINNTSANDTTANGVTVSTNDETADVNGTAHLNGHDSQMVNGTTACSDNTSHPKDYSSYEVLWKPPPVASMVAYKLLEMSTVDYTPHVSEYKEAFVRNIEGSMVELHVKPTPKTCNNDGGEVVKGRFEMPTDDDEQENEASEESDVVTHDWCELIEPRLLVERFEF